MSKRMGNIAAAMIMFAAAFAGAISAEAAIRKSPYVGAISVDAANGAVLFSDNAKAKGYPASVTKLMTAYLVLDDVKAGKFKLSDKVVASPVKNAADRWSRQPSQVGLIAGDAMSVDDLLKVLLVKSANDAAIFLAEKCSGSVGEFVQRMNRKAKSLGMGDTVYYNPNGLPPPKGAKGGKNNVSTCADLALLARSLLKNHPEILRWTSIKVCKVDVPGRDKNGNRIMQKLSFVNHNNVMVKNKLKVINADGTEAVDGLKTGYIDAGGSSVILTGKRGKGRAIVIVMGSNSSKERDETARKLMSDALDAVSW